MTTNGNYQVDDQMLLASKNYQGIDTQLGPEQVEMKPRRIRKKKKKEGLSGFRKRKLSKQQVNILEQSFEDEHKLPSERKVRMASELELDPRQVVMWFQNRRARLKTKKLEEDNLKLKNQLDSLKTEVLNLKDQLTHTDRERQRLLEMLSRNISNASSCSMEATSPFHYL